MSKAVFVGTIAIRVRPYTREFGPELKADLEKIEAKQDAIEIEVEPDTDGLDAKVAAAKEAAEKKIDSINIDVNVDYERSLGSALSRIHREIEKLGTEVDIPVELDYDSLGQANQALAAQLMDRHEVQIETALDRRSIVRAESQLQQLLDQQREISVDVDVDSARMESALRRASQRLRQFDIDERARSIEIDVKFSRDRSSLARTIRNIERELQEAAKLDVQVDTSRLEETLRATRRRYAREQILEIVPHLDQSALRRVEETLDHFEDEHDPLEIEVDPTMDYSAYGRISASLQSLTRPRYVIITPILNMPAARAVEETIQALSGHRVMHKVMDDLWRWIRNMDKNLPLIGSVAAAVMGLVAAVLALSSHIFMLVKNLAQIIPIALAMPGILAGFAFGIGSWIAVLKEFNERVPSIWESLQRLQDRMADAFWARTADNFLAAWERIFPVLDAGLMQTTDALATYTNAMVDAIAAHLPYGMPEMFDNLAESIEISARGAEDFAQIIEILGRHGSAWLPRLAQWWIEQLSAFRGWLDEADRTGRLADMLENAVFQMQELWRVIQGVYRILVDLIEAADRGGGATLTAFADWLDRIHQVTSSEGFQKGLARAFIAAHDAVDRFIDISGPRVSAFFSNFVDILERGLPSVAVILGEALGGIASALSTDVFTEGFIDFLAGFEELVKAIDFEMVGDGLGYVLDVLANFAREFGPLINEALKFLHDLGERLHDPLNDLVSQMAPQLLDFMQRVKPHIIDLMETLVDLLDRIMAIPFALEALIIGGFVVKVAMWFAPLLRVLIAVVAGVRDFVSGMRVLAQSGVRWWDNILPSRLQSRMFTFGRYAQRFLIGPLVALVAVFRNRLAPAVERVTRLFGNGMLGRSLRLILPRFVALLGPIGLVVAALWLLWDIGKLVVDFVQRMWKNSERLRDAWANLGETLQGVWERLRPAFERLGEAFASLFGTVLEALGEILGVDLSNIDISDWAIDWDNLAGSIGDAVAWLIEHAIPAIEWLADRLIDFIDWLANTAIPKVEEWIQAWVVFVDHVKQFLLPLWENLQTAVTTTLDVISTGMEGLLAFLKGDWETAWNAVKTNFETIWDGLSEIASNTLDAVKETVGEKVLEVAQHMTDKWNESSRSGDKVGSPGPKSIWEILGVYWDDILVETGKKMYDLGSRMKVAWNEILGDADRAWDDIKTLVTASWQVAKDELGDITEELLDSHQTSMEELARETAYNFTRMVAYAVDLWEKIKSFFDGGQADVVASVIAWLFDLRDNLVSGLARITARFMQWWDDLGRETEAGVKKVDHRVSELPEKLRSTLSSLPGVFRDAAVNMWEGFMAGMGAMVGRVVRKAAEIAQSAYEGVKKALGINSPSRVMIAIGKDGFGGGFALGLEQSEKTVNGAAKGLAAHTASAFDSMHGTAFKAGQTFGDGVATGIESWSDKVALASEKLGQTARDEFNSPLSMSLSDDDIADDAPWNNPDLFGDHVTVHGVPMDHAEETASEIEWRLKKARRGGRYKRRGADV